MNFLDMLNKKNEEEQEYQFEKPEFEPVSVADDFTSNINAPEMLEETPPRDPLAEGASDLSPFYTNTNQSSQEKDVKDEIGKNKNNNLQALYDEYMANVGSRQQQIKDAAEADKRKRLIQNLSDAFSKIGTGLASGYANVKLDPIDLGPANEEERTRAEQKGQLEDLLTQYKLKKAMTPEQMSRLEEAQLAKEQALAAKYEAEKKRMEAPQSEMEKIALETAQEKLKQLREPKEPSWEEKEVKKAEIEQKIETDKEKRKETADIKKSMSDIDEQLATVRKAKQQLAKVMKNKLADTGPIDQYIVANTKQGQLLKQTLSELSLKKMSKMFEGMSKAIDTGPEREIFESSQASLDKYSDNNMQILEDQEKALLNLKKKNNERINEISQNREQIQESSTSQKELSPIYGEVTERNGKKYKWNPSARKYQLID